MRPREGSQTGHADTWMQSVWGPANDDRLQGLLTNGSTESFREGDGTILAGVATFTLALAPSALAYTRQNTWRCNPKVDSVSQLLGHQLRSAPCQRLPV